MLFLNFFGCITNGPPDLFRVSGRSRACGHGLLPLRASPKAQSSGQNGHNYDRFQKFQCFSPPFAASCSYPFKITREATFLSSNLDVSSRPFDLKIPTFQTPSAKVIPSFNLQIAVALFGV
ncbi:MAG: hypothetical protein DME80_04710 [Verrucomicrobia bacterium]|nr:MAG: hypothetical protein DME80_04710 [Verrucomicrobiota bacterium]